MVSLRRVLAKAPVQLAAKQGGFQTRARGSAGMDTQLSAMELSGTVYQIVARKAAAFAQVDWRLYRKPLGKAALEAEGRNKSLRTEVTTHAALVVLNRPNPFMTRQELFERLGQHQALVGESWILVGRDERVTFPTELWPVTPARMHPVPSPDVFISGYKYVSPGGDTVPLPTGDVIFMKAPNPADPIRGLGPIQSVMIDMRADRYSAEWNLNFFTNGAVPGGVVELSMTSPLGQRDWDDLNLHWTESHKGVDNAHTVAFLEMGTYKEVGTSQKDMQFSELRGVTRDIIREAFGFSKTMMGQTEGVNRATAEAAEYVFAKWQLVPDLERIKHALNNNFLPLFGDSEGLYFDYDNPVEEDEAAEQAELTAKVNAVVSLIGAGFDRLSVAEAFDLPLMKVAPPAPAPAPFAHQHARPRAAGEPDFVPDLSGLQVAWERGLRNVLRAYAGRSAIWVTDLGEQVRALTENGGQVNINDLSIDTTGMVDDLSTEMWSIAQSAARACVKEAADQGVDIRIVTPSQDSLRVTAGACVDLLAGDVKASAAATALVVNGPDTTPEQVAELVRQHLRSLSDARPSERMGAALTAAENTGRAETMRAAPVEAYYASEVNDVNTCGPCSEVDGRWLGNSMADVKAMYPFGGYMGCEGGPRCRGSFYAVYRPEQTKGA